MRRIGGEGLLEIEELVVHAVGLQAFQAEYEVVFFQSVCGFVLALCLLAVLYSLRQQCEYGERFSSCLAWL